MNLFHSWSSVGEGEGILELLTYTKKGGSLLGYILVLTSEREYRA